MTNFLKTRKPCTITIFDEIFDLFVHLHFDEVDTNKFQIGLYHHNDNIGLINYEAYRLEFVEETNNELKYELKKKRA